jgi:hypothetical protein
MISTVLQLLLDSESDDEDTITIITNSYISKKPRIAIKNYVENVASLYATGKYKNLLINGLSEFNRFLDFKEHFRLQYNTFEYLLQILGPSLKGSNPTGVGRHTCPLRNSF